MRAYNHPILVNPTLAKRAKETRCSIVPEWVLPVPRQQPICIGIGTTRRKLAFINFTHRQWHTVDSYPTGQPPRPHPNPKRHRRAQSINRQ